MSNTTATEDYLMGMTNRTSRRELLVASGVAPALAPAEAPKRPNFVLFMPETLRAESVACYGHPPVRTPNLDRLAGHGVRFTQCHVYWYGKNGLLAAPCEFRRTRSAPAPTPSPVPASPPLSQSNSRPSAFNRSFFHPPN